MKTAALFVETGGTYFGHEDVDPWDAERDARRYRGPWPVIAHPPCKRWGRYWGGGPSTKRPLHKGDDDGCFAAALWCVRTFGGVLEHPEASHAWDWHGLERPLRKGGWTKLDKYQGRSCCVEQGHYGHRARKATWLYAVNCPPREFLWGPSEGERLDAGYHSAEERAAAGRSEREKRDKARLSARERLATPVPFRNELVALVCGGRER